MSNAVVGTGRVLVAMLLVALLSQGADGQVRYQPQRPTSSPYLNLLRRDNFGPLPNYQTFVQPMLQQQIMNEQFRKTIMSNQRALEQLSSQGATNVRVGSLEMRTPKSQTTGTGSVFRSYSHYYPRKGMVGGGRR